MSNTFFTGRALLPALLAVAFGAIALALALLIVPAPAASQTAPPASVITVRFAMSQITTGAEGEQIPLAVDLDASLTATRTITVLVRLTGGITDEHTLVIDTANNRSGAVLITLPSDNIAGRAPMPVVATLIPPQNNLYEVVSGMGSSVTITVRDDDKVTVGFDRTAYSVEEGDRVTVPVEFKDNIRPDSNTMVTVEIPGMLNQTVTLSTANDTRNVTFTAPDNDDARVSPLPVTLMIAPSADYNVDSNFAMATVSFTDDADPIAEVRFMGSANRSGDEGTDVTLRATLQPNVPATRAIDVRVDLSGGFTGMRTLTIPRNETGAEITITLDDDLIQGNTMVNRDVVATLVDDFFYDLSGTRRVTITVNDNDEVLVGFGAASYTAVEGALVTVTVGLKTNVNPASPISVRVNGVPGPPNRAVMLSSNTRMRDITFNVPGDERARAAPPPVTLMFGSPQNFKVAPGFGTATVRITDDGDAIAEVRFTSPASPSGMEGEMVTLRAALQSGQNATRAIDVRVDLGGGGMGEQTLTIADGSNFGDLQITLPTDNVAGMAPMPVVATLVDRIPGATTGAHGDYNVVSGATQMVTITVRDDDMVSVGFGAADYTFREGSPVMVTVELKNNVVPNNPISVTVQGPGQMQTRTLTLSAGNTSGDITFTAPNDQRAAPPPPVMLTITSSQGFNVAPSLGTTTVSFTDDGDPVARVGFVSPPTRLTEREMVTLNVELMTGGRPATRAVTVTVSDGVTGGFSRDVTIADGQTSTSFTYTAPNDGRAHAAPAARTLQLINPMNGGVAGASGSIVINYRDDNDPIAAVGFRNPAPRLTEGETEMLNVELKVGGPATRAITVTVSDGIGGFSQDVTIQGGQSSAGFSYTAPDDDHARIAPPPRTLRLSVPPEFGIVASGFETATISFRDDNDGLAVVGFGPDSDQEILQGGTARFRARLRDSVTATEAVDLRLMFSDGRDPRTVTIRPGQGTVEFDVETSPGGPTPPPLMVTITLPGGQALDANAASATLVQRPPFLGAETPSAGGLELGWGALAALLALALALAAAGLLLTLPRRRLRRNNGD